MASDNRGKKLSGGGQGFNEPNRNESIALLQTQGSFAAAAKLMLNLQHLICTKKETGRSPGGNTTG